MKNCGRRFHNEVGKFRFLNELIKVVSPKVSDINVQAPFNGDIIASAIFVVILSCTFIVFFST